MEDLVFATNNQHKLREIRAIVGDHYRILGLEDIGCHDEIPELEDTLEGNASLKARYVIERYGIDCFADDTGLETEALDGRPGVKSARYAGEDCNAENNINKLLAELKGITNRKARFRTVISLVRNGHEEFFEGIVEGIILEGKRGKDGFGYDPVFVPDGYEMSFAQMAPEDKNRISHRGVATRKLIGHLMHTA